MPMTATRIEPQGLELPVHGSTARNNSTQDFMHENVLARMPLFDRAPAMEAARQQPSDAATVPTSKTSKTSEPSDNNLAARMRLLIRCEGSMASIARRCGFSEGAVRSWRDGQSDISRERCVVMAKTLNVSLIWLITGEGPMRPDCNDTRSPHHDGPQRNTNAEATPKYTNRSAVNPRLLASALRLLQSYVGLLGGSLNPMQRADVLAELYDILGAAEEPGYIDRLIAFHATLSAQMRRSGSLVA